MQDLITLKDQYDLVTQKRIEELELPEEKKTLKGIEFMFIENKLCLEISDLKKSFGIDDGMKSPKNQKCHGCGKRFRFRELNLVGSFVLCEKCEDSHRQVLDDLADSQAEEIYGDQNYASR